MEFDFHVYLPAKVAADNTSVFNMALPQCLTLDGCWKVGLKKLFFPVALTIGTRQLFFVHSSIVKASAVGESMLTLLDVVPYATNGFYSPKDITYHSLALFNFDTIDIKITDQKFKAFQFIEGGTLLVVLHFKYQH